MRTIKSFLRGCCLCCLVVVISSCNATYHADTLEDSIKRLCKKEYGIENVEVKIKGKTLGVYLPLEKLFASSLNDMLNANSKVTLENLLKFHPEAMEKVEDVLFTTSRVILSTDRKIDFYVLKAGETKRSGLELVLIGYVDDMKRVRFWDIAISEYRKRLIHDLGINQTVVWHKTMEEFFESIGTESIDSLLKNYFVSTITVQDISPFFYSHLAEAEYKENLKYEIIDFKTKPVSEKEVLVYVKVRENFTPRTGYEDHPFLFKNNSTSEFLFVLQAGLLSYRIKQVIPFYYIDENNKVNTIEFPEELTIYKNIQNWDSTFELDEVIMSEFLAVQLTKRVQALLMQDERIRNTFFSKQMELSYIKGLHDNPGHYVFQCKLRLKGDNTSAFVRENIVNNENLLYLYDLILTEVMSVMHSYKFDDYDYILFQDADSMHGVKVYRKDLEQYRQEKISIQDLFRSEPPIN